LGAAKDMKLVVHMGLHKTATTSFQHFLYSNRNNLIEAGVLYPEIPVDEYCYKLMPNHNLIIHHILRNNWGYIENYMKDILNSAKENNVKTVFISGEDFETILIDNFHAVQFEKLTHELGYSEIQWVCVLRNQWDYFNSIYAQASKHGSCLDYKMTGEEIIEFGDFALGSYNRWKFAFDYDQIIERFLETVKGSLDVISFDNFKGHTHLGAELINKVINNKQAEETFWKSTSDFKTEHLNVSKGKEHVEISYLGNYLGIKLLHYYPTNSASALLHCKTTDGISPHLYSFLNEEGNNIVKHRLNSVSSVAEDLQKRFMERFPYISKRLD
jgi:hypothetical protein